jgi:hypothetical protein
MKLTTWNTWVKTNGVLSYCGVLGLATEYLGTSIWIPACLPYFALLILPKTTQIIRQCYWYYGLNGQLLISSSATALPHSVINPFGLSLFSITNAWQFHYANTGFGRAIPEVLARVSCLTELTESKVCLQKLTGIIIELVNQHDDSLRCWNKTANGHYLKPD